MCCKDIIAHWKSAWSNILGNPKLQKNRELGASTRGKRIINKGEWVKKGEIRKIEWIG